MIATAAGCAARPLPPALGRYLLAEGAPNVVKPSSDSDADSAQTARSPPPLRGLAVDVFSRRWQGVAICARERVIGPAPEQGSAAQHRFELYLDRGGRNRRRT